MCKSVYLRNNIKVEGNLNSPRTLIFAHGFGSDQSAWNDVKPAFVDQYKIVLYDQVGAGCSDLAAYSPAKYSSLYGYAHDLLELCHALELAEPVFIGHSASAIVGLMASSMEPDLFSSLILLTPSPRYLNDLGYVGGFEQEDLDALYQQMELNYYNWSSGFSKLAMGNPEQPSLAELFAGKLRELRPDIALQVIRSIFQTDIRSLLPMITPEVLIIQSNNDIAVAPEVGPYMHAHLKDAKLVNIDASGHLPHVSAAGAVITAIQNFLNVAT